MHPSNPVTQPTQSDVPRTIGELGIAALELALSGWPVHPLRGKHPITEHGFHDATTDAEQIQAWWARNPRANIGIAVPPGCVVVDVDRDSGGRGTLAMMQAEHGKFPPTLCTETGGGGLHLWFAADTHDLSQRVLGKGIQSRVGGRGYVVAPPSRHPKTGREYRWRQPVSPVAWAPRWLLALLRDEPTPAPLQRKSAPLPPTGDFSTWTGDEVLGWAAERVARAREGERHDTLLRTAILCAGHVRAGRVTEAEVERTLLEVAKRWQNHPGDRRAIRDGLAYGRGKAAIA